MKNRSANRCSQPGDVSGDCHPEAAALRVVLFAQFVLMLTVFGSAQTTKSGSQSTLTEKPISKYMREAGLLYLEQIDDFERDCARGWHECSETLDRWDRGFEPLEDRITISLSEPGRPDGDRPLFELLKRAKTSASFFLYENHFYEEKEKSEEIKSKGGLPNAGLPDTGRSVGEQREIMEAWLRISRTCRYYAHTFSLDGAYLDAGGCTDQFARELEKDGKTRNSGKAREKSPAVQPSEKFTGEESKARSWRTQAYCEKDGYVWKDGVCHARK
jgi:hypothetical protein